MVKELKRFQGLTIRVGYQDTEGTDLAVIDIAVFHEFGTINIPARPFFSSALDANSKQIGDMLQEVIGKIIDGDMTAVKAAERVGLFVKSLIQKRIRDSPNWAEPLAESTIEAKGSSTPLVDTGELLNSVTYAVLEKGTTVIASG